VAILTLAQGSFHGVISSDRGEPIPGRWQAAVVGRTRAEGTNDAPECSEERLRHEMSSPTPDLLELVRDAFDQARRSGKPEWWSMTSPVLKNRLLQRSQGSFRESDWGHESFRALLESGILEPVAEVDLSERPIRITLHNRDIDSGGDRSDLVGTDRIVRRDLWDAVMDLAGRTTWRWDAETDRVASGEGEGEILGPVSRPEMQQWRAEFADTVRGRPGSAVVDRWLDERLGSADLPRQLRSEWYEALKSHVIGYLEHWFADRGIPTPDDLVVERPRRDGDSSAAHADDRATELLRRHVLDAIRQMSSDELVLVQLPASAIFRHRS
jgi:hypothetical protein